MGSAPTDVKDTPTSQHELGKEQGELIKHNNDSWRQKAGRLRGSGAFRVPSPRHTWERIDAPKFDGEVHQVSGFKGANDEDAEGNNFPMKTVLAAPAGSQDVEIGNCFSTEAVGS